MTQQKNNSTYYKFPVAVSGDNENEEINVDENHKDEINIEEIRKETSPNIILRKKKRGPGRPKGSKNKVEEKVAKKPGRPKGSKNKAKIETATKKVGRPKGSKNKTKVKTKTHSREKLTLDKMKELAESKGGRCLSKRYKNLKTKMLWECGEGHRWKTMPHSIKFMGTWCPECWKTKHGDANIKSSSSIKKKGPGRPRGSKNKTKKQKVSAKKSKTKITTKGKKLGLDFARKLAQSKGGICLDKEYVSSMVKMKWACDKAHIWESTLSNIKNRDTWCPECFRERLKAQAEEKRKARIAKAEARRKAKEKIRLQKQVKEKKDARRLKDKINKMKVRYSDSKKLKINRKNNDTIRTFTMEISDNEYKRDNIIKEITGISKCSRTRAAIRYYDNYILSKQFPEIKKYLNKFKRKSL